MVNTLNAINGKFYVLCTRALCSLGECVSSLVSTTFPLSVHANPANNFQDTPIVKADPKKQEHLLPTVSIKVALLAPHSGPSRTFSPPQPEGLARTHIDIS